MNTLVDSYDAALFDLDGVVYVGLQAVPGAADVLATLRGRGVRCGFVTNNASRPPATVAQHLSSLGIAASAADVVSSAQAVAALMAKELPPGSLVFICGTDALAAEIAAVGLVPSRDIDAEAVALVQGYNPAWTVVELQQACQLIQRGVRWYASNNDLTIPTDRGIMPGMGSYLQLISTACGGARPVAIAGKPYLPLLHATLERIKPTRPLFVGDRLDTDIEGAHTAGIDSLLVINTGAHGKADLLTAPEHQRPTHIGADLGALLLPSRSITWDGLTVRCGQQHATLIDDVIECTSPVTMAEQLDALWCAAQLAWRFPQAQMRRSLETLDLLH
ncbi:MAG: HAD-IIA family hydrolase [Propionibacteriaceae bacterium]